MNETVTRAANCTNVEMVKMLVLFNKDLKIAIVKDTQTSD